MAKLAGLSLCASYNRQYGTRFINVIPSNLYGPCDNFDPLRSHVIAALIQKFHTAKEKKESELTLWGSGNVARDFLFVDDLVDACHFLMKNYSEEKPINVGAYASCTIRRLAEEIAKVTRFTGEICWDISKPDGAPQRTLGTGHLTRLGWKAKTGLSAGLEKTYQWYKENICTS